MGGWGVGWWIVELVCELVGTFSRLVGGCLVGGLVGWDCLIGWVALVGDEWDLGGVNLLLDWLVGCLVGMVINGCMLVGGGMVGWFVGLFGRFLGGWWVSWVG